MKRFFAFLFLLLFLSSDVSAHPGRLDSDGGHWNRSTGEYHYHDGNSSNLYPDSSDNVYYYPPLTKEEKEAREERRKYLEQKRKAAEEAEARNEKIRAEKQKDDARSGNLVIACSCYCVFVFFYLQCSDSTFFKG